MTANSEASSIPQTGSTGTNFSVNISIYRYVELDDIIIKKLRINDFQYLFWKGAIIGIGF